MRALFLNTLASKELCVLCCDGVVTLCGTVKHERDWLAAEKAAKGVRQVLTVVNRIKIEQPIALIETRRSAAEVPVPERGSPLHLTKRFRHDVDKQLKRVR